jgi:heparosan-N-sulfate-glucuronate 5-epimerase
MNRKVVVAFFVSSMLSSVLLGILFVTPAKAYHNYWSVKNDVNFFSDQLQNAADIDDIGDTSNVSDMKKLDKYSLMEAYGTQHDMVGIYFDRSIYYPDVRVFWEPNLSVPIEIRVVDRDVNGNSVKVNASSSIDSKEVTLTKDVLRVFSGTVFAVGIGLRGEPFSNTSSLNVRYGDEIIAEYFDMNSGNNFTASALFVLPHYVTEACFNNVDSWESASNIVFDSNGIPLVNYGSSIGIQYNPVTISQYALANYHAYLDTRNTTRREKFLAQANWLVENAKQKGNFSVWEYTFDNPAYGCTKPWVSAMAQGEGLSVLARAYVLTGNISYTDVAEEVILSFEVEMSAGGVRYTDSSGVWFEECADEGASSGKVLNGFIFALLGLCEYSFETNDSQGWTFFWEGAETLSNNIYRYDSGSWSYYDLLHHSYASSSYHKLHIEQLRTMYKLTDDEVFLYYSDRFQSYISTPPPPPPTSEHTLTVYTLPSGVTFTVNNVSHTTPWSGTYENETSVSLVMPETHTVGDSRYYWDQWSDGEANQSRTFAMDTNITLAAYFTGPCYQLAVTSSPIIGIIFSIAQMSRPTPYTGWLLEGSYTLEMPEIHGGYVWSHWLEDGDTNRIKTVTLPNTTWTAIYVSESPPVVTATVDVDPDVTNLLSESRWITTYMELPAGFNVADINATTILLNGTIPSVLDPKYGFVTNSSEYLVDHDGDGILERMVKFNRTELTSYIYNVLEIKYGNVTLTISGNLMDGKVFEASDTIKVIRGGRHRLERAN